MFRSLAVILSAYKTNLEVLKATYRILHIQQIRKLYYSLDKTMVYFIYLGVVYLTMLLTIQTT
jgi:hypothetical protein